MPWHSGTSFAISPIITSGSSWIESWIALLVGQIRRDSSVKLRRMKFAILFVGLLAMSGCNASNDFHVMAYKTVEGADSAPWPSGCLVTVESRTQRIVGLYGLPCKKIQIGDKAVFNHKGDTVFRINDIGYSVRSAQAK